MAGESVRIESESAGWRAVLRPGGIGRYFVAAFLLVWLCGWAAGEIAVGWVLVWIATDGWSQSAANSPTPLAGVLIVCFLLLWFTLWTLGGLAAFRELLRLLFGSDAVGIRQGRLQVEHRAGPARWGSEMDRGELERIELRKKDGALVATLKNGSDVALTTLGTREQREEVLRRLLAELRLDAPSPGPASYVGYAPEGWQADLAPDLAVILRPVRSHPLVRGGCITLPLLAAAAVLIALLRETPAPGSSGAGNLAAAVVLGALSILFGWGAARALFGREEWRFSGGAAEFRRTFAGLEQVERFENAALRLDSWVDSDGDEHLTVSVASTTKKRRLTASIGPGALRVAEWIAAHGGLPMQPPPRRREQS